MGLTETTKEEMLNLICGKRHNQELGYHRRKRERRAKRVGVNSTEEDLVARGEWLPGVKGKERYRSQRKSANISGREK